MRQRYKYLNEKKKPNGAYVSQYLNRAMLLTAINLFGTCRKKGNIKISIASNSQSTRLTSIQN